MPKKKQETATQGAMDRFLDWLLEELKKRGYLDE